MKKRAFTMLELIFVIVVMAILAKFGVDIMQQIYNNYVYSNRANTLQSESDSAINQIANRLQHRIKDSVISSAIGHVNWQALGSNTAANNTVLEWVGIDYDGWRGNAATTTPLWSGVIDLSASAAPGTPTTSLVTPATTARSGIYNNGTAAVYFLGSNVDMTNGFGWNGQILDQGQTLHPVTIDIGTVPASLKPTPGTGTFSGQDIFEFYQLANSAFAVELNQRVLTLYTDYQPWDGETYQNGTPNVLMRNVTTFKFSKVGDLIKIEICIGDTNQTGEGEYSVCKERTVF